MTRAFPVMDVLHIAGASLAFPLDRAPHGRGLPCRRGFSLCYGSQCVQKLGLRIRRCGFCTGAVQTTAILKAQIGIKTKEIRGADSAISSCNLLRFVNKIGERKAMLLGKNFHVLEGVGRVVFRVVGHDGYASIADILKLSAGFRQPFDYGLYVRAVITDKHHQQAFRTTAIGEG